MPPTIVDLLIEFAKFTVALGALVVAVSAIAKAPFVRRPARFFFRSLIGDPVAGWFRHEISTIVDERLNAQPWANGKGIAAVHQVQAVVEEIRDVVTSDQEDIP